MSLNNNLVIKFSKKTNFNAVNLQVTAPSMEPSSYPKLLLNHRDKRTHGHARVAPAKPNPREVLPVCVCTKNQ